MSTFQVQLEDLAGGSSVDTAAMSDWLTAGARTVLDVLSPTKLQRIASNTNFTDSLDVEGKKILAVTRKDANNSNRYMPCRGLTPNSMGKVLDSNYMEYASTSDPAYIVHNDVLNTYPQSVASNDSRVVYVNSGITVAFGDSAIANFPDEAESAVVSYASRNYLQRLMTNLISNTDITTALDAANTELDETLLVCDAINTNVDSAVAEILETVTTVDTAVDTALTAMTTAAGRINTAVGLANTQLDSAVTANTAEDIELASSHVNAGSGFIGEATASASELSSYGVEVQQRLAQVGAQGQVAARSISAAQGFATELQSKIGIASGYLQEMQGRLAVDTTKYSWYEKQYQMADARYKEQIEILKGTL